MGHLDADGQFVSSSQIRLELGDQLAILTLVNPPVNAVDTNLVRKFGAALDRIAAEPSIRVVIVTAEGGQLFSAGSDILEMSTMLAPGQAVERKLSLQFDVFGRLAALDLPTIAVLNGHALGGGLEIAVCCDLIVAEEHVQLGSPEIRVGLFPSSGGTFRVARRIGPGRAKELQLLGQPISAARALDWGLINRVAARGDGLAVARDLARTLIERPALGLTAVKQLVEASADLDEAELVAMSLRTSEKAFTSADGVEGIEAFLHKRPARFAGQPTANS